MEYRHNDEMLLDILTYMDLLLTIQENKSAQNDIVSKNNALDELIETIHSKSVNSTVFLSLPQLQHILQLTPLEYQLLWIIAALEMAGDLRGRFQKLFGTKRLDYTFGLVLLQSSMSICFQDILLCLEKESNLWLVLSLKQEDAYYHMEKSISLEEFVFGYIVRGKPVIKQGIFYQQTDILQLLDIHQEVYEQIKEKSYCLFGHEGIGKHGLYYRLCKQHNQDSMCIDGRLLDREGLECLAKQCIFNSLLFNHSICIDHVTANNVPLVSKLMVLTKEYAMSIVIISNEDIELAISKYQVRDFLNRGELQQCMQPYVLNPLVKEEILYGHFIIKDFFSLLSYNEQLSVEQIHQYQNHSTFFNPYCTCYTSSITLDNWQGNVFIKEKLEYILYLIRHKEDIFVNANSKGHFLQQSVSAVFHGSSGTGKTYGAKAIAGQLKKRLLIANLAKINDKYIGETEKHLEEIFYLAYKHHCILFFDEADVLFTKRTSVQQANDKYANISTAYLLQKIENFDGIVILATNLISNFDDAFLRRINMIIKFEASDKEDRENMYRILCKDISLDYSYLADLYSFSLARIEQVVFMAHVIASKENKEVDMEIIIKAMQWELAKQGEILVEKG